MGVIGRGLTGELAGSGHRIGAKEHSVVEAIKAGQQPIGQSDIQAAYRAASKGWIVKQTNGWQLVDNPNTVAFIPNSFVQVTEGNSPLHRLFNFGEIGPIMLAAELYQLQNLMDDRGVAPEVIRGYFYSARSRRTQNHIVHQMLPGRIVSTEGEDPSRFEQAVEPKRLRSHVDNQTFWLSMKALDETHVIEWPVYNANGKPDGKFAYNRPQKPLGVLRNGKQVLNTPESRPAFLAFLVHSMLEPNGNITAPLPQLIAEWRQMSPIIAFENASVTHVEGISFLRMSHRAATENTRVWYGDLCEECDRAFFFIEDAVRSTFPQLSKIIEEIKKERTLEKLSQL